MNIVEGKDHKDMSQRPAFPVGPQEMTGPDGETSILFSPGMSIRDYIATAALQGFISSQGDQIERGYWGAGERPIAVRLANFAYILADAMIEARNNHDTKN